MRGKLKYRERFTTYAFDDQSELNWIAMENNIPMTMMSKSFNSKPAPGVMITHYLGTLKTKYDNDNMSDIDIDLSRISGNKPKVEKKNSGLAILRCSEINQQHLWGEGEESCHNEFIVCRDESLNLPHVMKGNVLYVKSDREKFEYNMFKAISTLTELKKNTHFAMVDINQNRSKYFDDINLQKLRQIHAAGESLRFKSTSKEPFIISRRTISYCKKSGPNRDRWRAKIANEGIEIFNFDYLKSP